MAWAIWFNGVTVTNVGTDEVLLVAELPDQAALHGLLAQIRDLNFTLISVQLVSKGAKPI